MINQKTLVRPVESLPVISMLVKWSYSKPYIIAENLFLKVFLHNMIKLSPLAKFSGLNFKLVTIVFILLLIQIGFSIFTL